MIDEKLVSIVIPAKNEEKSILKLLDRILSLELLLEVIVVNDGSTDNTVTQIDTSKVKIINHIYSKGNGAAIKSGARAAKGDVIIFMDADGQHDPNDIPKLLEKIHEGYDMAVGARSSSSQASVGRGIANKFYNSFSSYITGHRIEDLTSGFRAVRAKKFREFLYLLPNGFSYPTTCTMAFFRAGYSVAYVPIIAAKRIGKSHIKLLKDGIRFLLIIFKIGTLYSPLKIFFPISLLHAVLGLSYYFYTFSTDARLSIVTIFLLTASVTIFLIGLVSEQITQLIYKDSGTDD